ncbi:MAG TPA: hypothetical protein VNA69_12605 [Thermoanaerobaculia bacterium]|nr:hypothetical protein [Thermoanaerobaculia bacterium]
MKRILAIAFVVFGLAGCGFRMRLAYDGQPRLSHHGMTRVSEPKAVEVARDGSSGTALALGGTREGDEFRIKVTIKNYSPFSSLHQYVHEFRDYRGSLVRRHTFGPLEIEAGAERTFYDTLRIPRSEKRYVDRESMTVEDLERWSQS